jgi:ParB family transcriptional regulator, chromosome partitioning protein
MTCAPQSVIGADRPGHLEIAAMPRTFEQVPLKKIKPNHLNPRLEFRKDGLDELSASLGRVGILEPILLRRVNGAFEVVVGERRYRAAQQAGLDEVPAIVGDYTDEQVIEMNLIENVQRDDLNDVEKGRSCIQLLETAEEQYPNSTALAKKLGVSPKTVNLWIQTARDLSPALQRMVASTPERGDRLPRGRITSAVAVKIARQVPERERQVEVARAIADRQIPTLAAREVLRMVAREPGKPVERVIREVVDAPPELPFRLKHAEMIKAGRKVQTSRKGLPDPGLKPGAVVFASVYEPKFLKLRVRSVERKRLGQFTPEDADMEGGYTLAEFKKIWNDIHDEGWNDEQPVYVIRFEVAK